MVLDEAFVEFADCASRAGWVQEHNSLVLRTFSKAAGIDSLQHAPEMEEVVGRLRTEREHLYAALAEVPYLQAVQGSQANFILCRVVDRDAAGLKQALEQQGVLVRYYRKPGLENCIRISVGRPEHTARLMEALHSLETQPQ